MTPGHEVLVVDSDVVSYLRLGKDRVAAESFRTETRDARILAISFATYGEVLATGYSAGWGDNGGANDLWTAACALTQSPPLPVLTNNLRDFDAIARQRPDLVVVHPSRRDDQRA